MRVLLVDDEADVTTLVAAALQQHGFETVAADSVSAAIDRVESEPFDIAILDLGLGDGSGVEVLDRIIQLAATTHVVVLSGESGEDQRVEVIERGADDFVAKPFSVRELAARIAAVRRRRENERGRRLAVGEVVIDTGARTVAVAGRSVELTNREFDLLAFLAENPGMVFDRDRLLREVWQSSRDWQLDSTVTEHVRRLRIKLDPLGQHPEVIRTVRGVGYCIDRVNVVDAERDRDRPPRAGHDLDAPGQGA